MAIKKNKYCKLKDLKNEATVEALFVNHLLSDLGFEGDDIAYKTSISELAVGKGSKKVLYRPDYVLSANGIPTVVVDAKSPSENIENWEAQCSSYSLEINKLFDYNHILYFILTNGLKLSIYKWDMKSPILSLDFDDFQVSNRNYKKLIKIAAIKNVAREAAKLKDVIDNKDFMFEAISHSELHAKFQKLHKFIWKAEKKGPSAAFIELMKILFIKIKKDKQIYTTLGAAPKPKYKDVIFSTHWLTSQTEEESPINDPLFKNLVNALEKEIS